METLILLAVCFVGYIIAYNTYGRFLARKIFRLDNSREVPSRKINDGIDYVPSKRGIIFGHHYTSIAGTGPIVGPAIGIIWGWLPAVLWIFLGSIFMGAVHDFGSLVISMRNEGRSVSEAAAKYINKRVRFIFFAVVFLTLLILIAVFGVVIASVFTLFPNSVIPVWFQIPIAVLLGKAVYKMGANVNISTAAAVIAMYLMIIAGSYFPIEIPSMMGIPASGVWVILLLIYAWIASTLSVTTLLQPRDYINAWQLFVALTLLIAGAVFSGFTTDFEMSAPMINQNVPETTPAIWPFMFVVIACGAVSGFHSLVASGTSPKQVEKETDSLFVGYGSMLLEGVLALLVIVCVSAGIGMALEVDGQTLTGAAAWNEQYSNYIGSQGLNSKLRPVVLGAANMMGSIGIPAAVGTTLMGVFIASFASTTLDTSVRLQRYVVGELAQDFKISWLKNRWTATSLAVLTAAGLAFANGAGGKGALVLWPLFGSANQLLAALALLVITLYLRTKGGKKFIFALIPCIFMLIITNWAMVLNEIRFAENGNILLVAIGGLVFLLALWVTIEAGIVFARRPAED
ncbi:Carbon starvation protein A [Sedimentisphaera cyanobacteriorum]|uniref:Carbon starvation protein A n=1 Tax=Sedimentisphaera cyanobacteriorum TaxID=1940790 RepID=A0A1Q2HQQ8_9BACT|nr:carbon starvation protein A [Sedimentisphaera cyanobacteriorum]AQQ09787.1 Carbon starvation protein A [Sedimentisphaera cyanobacteriorum]